MDFTVAFSHIGYVFCFWAVWKSLDVSWNILRVDTLINRMIGRQSELETQIAGKLSYFNKVRETDDKKTRALVNDVMGSLKELTRKLTPGMDDNLRSTVYGLHERLKLATDGLKFDHELAKEVEKLKKKVHELNKSLGDPPPCYLPVDPLKVEPAPTKKAPAKKATAKKGISSMVKEVTQNEALQHLAKIKGGYVSAAANVIRTQTNKKPGSLSEPSRYATPHQLLLERISQELKDQEDRLMSTMKATKAAVKKS